MKLISSAPVEIPDAWVGRDEPRRGWLGAGGDDRLVEANDPRALRGFDAQGFSRGELAFADHRLDLPLLRKPGQAAGQALDYAVLPAANGRGVEGRRAKAHAVRTHRLGVIDDLGDMQQRLGWNTADVEADAAQRRPRVDQNDVLPQIGGAEGGGVAAGTRAQNQDFGLEIGLAARISRGLRQGTCGSGGLWSGLLDLYAGVLGASGRSGGRRASAFGVGRQQVALAHLVADLDVNLPDHALIRRHIHGRLVAFERQDCLVLAHALPRRDEDFDDRHILEVADVGKPDFVRHVCLSIGPRSQNDAPHVLQEAREMAHKASARGAVDHPVIVR